MISIPWTTKPKFGTKLNKDNFFIKSLSIAMAFNEGGGLNVYNYITELPHLLRNGSLYNGGYAPEFIDDQQHIQGPNGSFLTGKSCITFGYQATSLPSAFCYAAVLEDDFDEFSIYWSPTINQLYVEINGNYLEINGAWVANLRNGKFHMFSFQWNDATNNHEFYLDGKLVHSVVDSFNWDSSGVDDHYLAIGGRSTGLDRYIGGCLPFFYVHNTNFTANKIAELHNNPHQIYEPIKIYVDQIDVGPVIGNPYYYYAQL